MLLIGMAVVILVVAECIRDDRGKWRMREIGVWAGILGIILGLIIGWLKSR